MPVENTRNQSTKATVHCSKKDCSCTKKPPSFHLTRKGARHKKRVSERGRIRPSISHSCQQDLHNAYQKQSLPRIIYCRQRKMSIANASRAVFSIADSEFSIQINASFISSLSENFVGIRDVRHGFCRTERAGKQLIHGTPY